MNIPNILTVIRIILVGVFVYVFKITKNYPLAIAIFVIAGITDLLDGYIARKYNMISDLGKLLDPLADKLMLVAALYCLVSEKFLHPAFLIIVAAKELAMIIGAFLFYRKDVVVYSKFMGKAASFLFNVGIVLTFFDSLFPFNVIVLCIAIIFAIAAMIEYLVSFKKQYRNSK